MISKRFFGLLTLPLLFIAGCAKDVTGPDVSGDGAITFNISIADGADGGQTRVATDAEFKSMWEDGDAIGIFARAVAGNLESSGNIIHNARLTYDADANDGSGAWSLDEGVKLKFPNDGSTKLVFHAYYPYDENATDPTAIAFNVEADQNGTTTVNSADRSNYNLSDLLAAKSDNDGEGYGAGDQVTLTFSHALAMVQVTVDNSSKVLDTEKGTIIATLVGVQSSSTLNLATSATTTTGPADDIAMYRVEKPDDVNYATRITFRALVPAGQTLAAGAQLFEITVGNVVLQSPALISPITLTAAQAELFAVGMPLPAEEVMVSIDGSSGTISANIIGEGLYEIEPCGDGSKLVESITIGENNYLIGRKDNETITLKIDPETGNLLFRDAEVDEKDGIAKIPIGSYAELALIGASTANLQQTVSYLQEADLDLMSQNWTPIGGSSISTRFLGSYYGGGHTITNLYINSNLMQGSALFGSVGSGGKLTGIGIESGSVKGGHVVGGVCGMNGGTITGCYNKADVWAISNVGGISGTNTGTITECYNTGSVSAGSYDNAGGVCGYNNTGTITECYNTGSVSAGSYDNAGGVCGSNTGTITECQNSGPVTGKSNIGGVCGENSLGFNTRGTITDCQNSGSVTGSKYIGGVCGNNQSDITDCNNSGPVTEAIDYAGGVCGTSTGNITYCSNSGVVTGYDSVGGVCGESKGTGTITACYNIGTLSGMIHVAGVCSMNAGSITTSFNTGAVSGEINFIGGVCGENVNDGTITACYNTGVVSGISDVGGVCGLNYNTITACYNIGAVSGDANVGGVRGVYIGTSTITACYYLPGGTDGTGTLNAGDGIAFSDAEWPTTTTDTAWGTTTDGTGGGY